MTEPNNDLDHQPKTGKNSSPVLVILIFLIALLTLLLVVDSARQEGNNQRRPFVPEALDAAYKPYPASVQAPDNGTTTPVDSMVRDIYVAQREINQGAHQLFLFFDTFTHRPAPLNLKDFDLNRPQDAQWYNFAIYFIILLVVVVPSLSLVYLEKMFKKKDQQAVMDRVMTYIIRHKVLIFILLVAIVVLLSLINLSIPLNEQYEHRADPFFVFVCFSSFAVAALSIKHIVHETRSERFKLGDNTSLMHKETFRRILLWSAMGIWAMGFLCYFMGMYSLGTQKSVLASIVRPALESGKMFVLSDNVKDISFTLRENGAFMGFYTLCKLAFLLISSFAVVSLMWSRISSFWSIRNRFAVGDLYVFFGINESSKILAHSIAAKMEGEKGKKWTLVMVENRNTPVDGNSSGLSLRNLMGMFNFRKEAFAETRAVSQYALLVVSNSPLSSRECSEQVNEMFVAMKNGEDIEQSKKYELFNVLGLKNLSKMLQRATSRHFFFLDDEPRTNIDGSDNLRKMLNIVHPAMRATIYCLARDNAFSKLLQTPLWNNASRAAQEKVDNVEVKILDLSLMAVQSLFMDPENHPINFVERDTATASVKSRFEALIIGFGNAGRDIVRYLYEFGAFLDHKCAGAEDNHPVWRSPFQCTIMDQEMDKIKPRYMAKIPAVKDACNNNDKDDPLLRFEQAAIDSEKFVDLLTDKLKNPDMNYVVICLGNDKTNMSALTFVVDQALRVRKGELGELRIYVRNYKSPFESAMLEQAAHYNQLLGGKPVVNVFGNRSVLFSHRMIVDDQIICSARELYAAYNNLKGTHEKNWDERHDEGRGIEHQVVDGKEVLVYKGITWQQQNKIVRQETQDIHNGMHVGTKLRLLGLDGINDADKLKRLNELTEALSINVQGNKVTCTVKKIGKLNTPLLHLNMARNEHLRWNASHEMLGYIGALPHAEFKCDETAKVHNCLVNWDELDEATQWHNQNDTKYPVDYKAFDYLMVKTSLQLAAQRLAQQQSEVTEEPGTDEQAKADA